MIDFATSSDPAVLAILRRHPHVAEVGVGGLAGVAYRRGQRLREVRVGDADSEVCGLVELMDNNPLVCADSASVPSPAATLALIGLGPLASAGMIVEQPVMVVNVPSEHEDIRRFLATAGWEGGVSLHVEPHDLDSVAVATVMVEIPTPDDPDDVSGLFEERFGRSFFVARDEDSEWEASLVAGTPRAVYRISMAADRPRSLVTIRVMGDLAGKLGAAQVVHCMNVMCGFEESLGLGS